MALVINDRVKETSTTTGTGTFSLAGAATGFETFVAGIATGNTTYYAIFNQGTTEWEVGLGTVTDATPDTLARTTVITSSNSDSAVDFAAGTKDVFCTLPASKAVYLDASGNQATGVVGKVEGTNFTDSLLVGHSTTGTLSTASGNTGVGLDTLDAITTGDNNVAVGYLSGTVLTTGYRNTLIGEGAGEAVLGGHNNTLLGNNAGGLVAGGNFNILLGTNAGDNITSGSGNVMIGHINADSATGSRQLKIVGNDNSTTTNWISGDSDGTVSANGGELTTTGKSLVMGF